MSRRTQRPRGFVAGWRPRPKTQAILADVAAVIEEYRQHLPLTVRQIFYRLVASRGYEKTEQAYARLCEALVMARRAQLVEFAHIRDDGAPLPRFIGFDHPRAFVALVQDQARHLHLDRQARTRPRPYVVVMCEAAGMAPQLEGVAYPFSVPVLGSGGFASLTFAYGLARWAVALGRAVEVLHIGDHDPSGVHIFGALADDVGAFARHLGGAVRFSRLAVNPGQARKWVLPTAPAKATDRRRFEGVGGDPVATVQAEAIPPDKLAKLLSAALRARIPDEAVAQAKRDEDLARRRLDAGLARLPRLGWESGP
jgi:hypothetical protein